MTAALAKQPIPPPEAWLQQLQAAQLAAAGIPPSPAPTAPPDARPPPPSLPPSLRCLWPWAWLRLHHPLPPHALKAIFLLPDDDAPQAPAAATSVRQALAELTWQQLCMQVYVLAQHVALLQRDLDLLARMKVQPPQLPEVARLEAALSRHVTAALAAALPKLSPATASGGGGCGTASVAAAALRPFAPGMALVLHSVAHARVAPPAGWLDRWLALLTAALPLCGELEVGMVLQAATEMADCAAVRLAAAPPAAARRGAGGKGGAGAGALGSAVVVRALVAALRQHPLLVASPPVEPNGGLAEAAEERQQRRRRQQRAGQTVVQRPAALQAPPERRRNAPAQPRAGGAGGGAAGPSTPPRAPAVLRPSGGGQGPPKGQQRVQQLRSVRRKFSERLGVLQASLQALGYAPSQ